MASANPAPSSSFKFVMLHFTVKIEAGEEVGCIVAEVPCSQLQSYHASCASTRPVTPLANTSTAYVAYDLLC